MITCWRCQKIVSAHIDEGAAFPHWARQHMESCARCRKSYESAVAVAQRLSVSAGAERREPPPFLHGKIMSAVRSEGDAARKPAAVRLGWVVALSTACVVAVTIASLRRPPDALHSIPTPAPVQQVLNVSVPASARVDQWLTTSEAPLENETQLVLDDAKTAMNTLAKSFLPDDLLGSSTKNGVH